MYVILKRHFVIDPYVNIFDSSIYNFASLFEICKKNESINKFQQLDNVLSNIFLTLEQKSDILDIFCKMQRFIHAMIRLRHLWLMKKTKVYNTEDLFMNPIHTTDRNVMVLLQNNTKYVFHLRELMNTIQTSLTNSTHFFAEPTVCKNPYTNIPFNKSSLYNIYFSLKSSSFILPVLFHKYFLCDFDLICFSLNNEYLVNDEYLEKFVENNCQRDVLHIVREMFVDFGIKTMRVHNEFPKDRLFNIMKPYLELYYVSQYSMNTCKKEYSERYLRYKLSEFCKHNPKFGRKRVLMVRKNPFIPQSDKEIAFNDSHISFNEQPHLGEEFMKSHLYKRIQNVFPGIPRITIPTPAHRQIPVEEYTSDPDTESGDTVVYINNEFVQAVEPEHDDDDSENSQDSEEEEDDDDDSEGQEEDDDDSEGQEEDDDSEEEDDDDDSEEEQEEEAVEQQQHEQEEQEIEWLIDSDEEDYS